MNLPGDFPPQRVLTLRRKRAFLSFRRKSDLVWFLTSVIVFSGGVAAFVLALVLVGKARAPLPTPPVLAPLLPTPPAVVVPVATSTGTFSVAVTSHTLPSPAKVKRPVVGIFPSRTRFSGTKAPLPTFTPVRKIEVKTPGYLLLQQAGPFKTLADKQAKLSVDLMEGGGDLVLNLNYDLSNGEWVQCFVNIHEDFSKYSQVHLLMKGEGSNNTLEFKLVDSDGTNMGAIWSQLSGKTGWTVVDVPLADLFYMWGGDRVLDLKRVRQIFFAVSKKPGDKGGRGRVLLRGIKFS